MGVDPDTNMCTVAHTHRLLLTCSHTCIYAHKHSDHAQTCALPWTCCVVHVLPRMCTLAHVCAPLYICMYLCLPHSQTSLRHTHTQPMQTHAHARACVYTHMHAHTCMNVHASTHFCTHRLGTWLAGPCLALKEGGEQSGGDQGDPPRWHGLLLGGGGERGAGETEAERAGPKVTWGLRGAGEPGVQEHSPAAGVGRTQLGAAARAWGGTAKLWAPPRHLTPCCSPPARLPHPLCPPRDPQVCSDSPGPPNPPDPSQAPRPPPPWAPKSPSSPQPPSFCPWPPLAPPTLPQASSAPPGLSQSPPAPFNSPTPVCPQDAPPCPGLWVGPGWIQASAPPRTGRWGAGTGAAGTRTPPAGLGGLGGGKGRPRGGTRVC